ncbi:hypothetical protein Salat_0221300, partial [Sesamum alatum]
MFACTCSEGLRRYHLLCIVGLVPDTLVVLLGVVIVFLILLCSQFDFVFAGLPIALSSFDWCFWLAICALLFLFLVGGGCFSTVLGFSTVFLDLCPLAMDFDLDRLGAALSLTEEESGLVLLAGMWHVKTASRGFYIVGRLLSSKPFHLRHCRVRSKCVPANSRQRMTANLGAAAFRFTHKPVFRSPGSLQSDISPVAPPRRVTSLFDIFEATLQQTKPRSEKLPHLLLTQSRIPLCHITPHPRLQSDPNHTASASQLHPLEGTKQPLSTSPPPLHTAQNLTPPAVHPPPESMVDVPPSIVPKSQLLPPLTQPQHTLNPHPLNLAPHLAAPVNAYLKPLTLLHRFNPFPANADWYMRILMMIHAPQ